jgi:hypothetical protein
MQFVNQRLTSRLLTTLFTPLTLRAISSAFAFSQPKDTLPLSLTTQSSTSTETAYKAA